MNELLEFTDVKSPRLPPPAEERAGRPYRWWVAGTVIVVLLILLGIAEATWLHDLPQDRASRVSLIVVPEGVPAAGQAGSAGTLPTAWSADLLHEATKPELMVDVVKQLDLRDATTGQPLTAAALAANLYLADECIDVRAGPLLARRGVMINAVVRSTGALDPEAVAKAWSDQFIQHGHAAWPGLTVQPAMGVQYELCR